MLLAPSKSTGGEIGEMLLYQFLLHIKITNIDIFAFWLKLTSSYIEMWFLLNIIYEIKILLVSSTFANEPVLKLVLARVEGNEHLNVPVCSTGADVVNVVGTRTGMFPSWYWILDKDWDLFQLGVSTNTLAESFTKKIPSWKLKQALVVPAASGFSEKTD